MHKKQEKPDSWFRL